MRKTYTFQGKKYSAPSGIRAYYDILQKFAKMEPNFWNLIIAHAPKKSRNHVARSVNEVYPGCPDLDHRIKQIEPGVFVGDDLNHVEKGLILEKSCKLLGLEYGKDLVW